MIDMMPAVDFLHYSKIMLDETTIEQRLVNLEQTVAELKRLLIAAPTPSNWLEKVTGSISDEQVFLKVLEYGESLRHADRPTDETTDQT
ncbi:transferase hexapeptide repeat containing protein [Nostoc sp. NMS9]|uniref:transferase hexapeptide repeat containing protein n=1 Tax=Nostoc sp. NMS9 TaxID=2815393 RepID=UPI0025DB7FBF|nr:transferase hexapeptide repeat containing protein [Nostoc sp. NMS9]